jgi:microcystin-dependent protein
MPLKNGKTTASLQTTLVGSVIPPGTIAPFGGGTVPEGWLLCNGSTISRLTYSALFLAISTAHGSGDGSTTFNLPDYRGTFLRGRVDISTKSGSGTASSNNATFTSHGINRTGFKVRLSSGTLSGLATATDYFAIVIDSNTLAFATSLANAIAGTKVAISGANSAVIVQFEDPDASSRTASTIGGNSTGGLGSVQNDAFQGHYHNIYGVANQGVNVGNADNVKVNSTVLNTAKEAVTDGTNGTPRTSSESRPKNCLVNYIIKY